MRRAINIGLIALVIVGVAGAVYSSSVMYATSLPPVSAAVADASVGAAENNGSMGTEWILAGLTVVGSLVFMLRPRRRTL